MVQSIVHSVVPDAVFLENLPSSESFQRHENLRSILRITILPFAKTQNGRSVIPNRLSTKATVPNAGQEDKEEEAGGIVGCRGTRDQEEYVVPSSTPRPIVTVSDPK